jgi:hypothetical protein
VDESKGFWDGIKRSDELDVSRVEALMVEKLRITELEAWTTSIARRTWNGEHGRGAWKEEHEMRSRGG